MKTAHVGLGISDADCDAILGRMRVDIVEKKP